MRAGRGRGAAGAGPGTRGHSGRARHGAIREGLGRGRHPAPQPAGQRAQVPPAVRGERRGWGSPGERVEESPVSFLFTLFPLSVPEGRSAQSRSGSGPREPQPGHLHRPVLAEARAAPSEAAWISLRKQRAELCRNFCSFLQFLVGGFHRRGARLSKLYFLSSPLEDV